MVDLGFLSVGRKEKAIFDGILRLIDVVAEAVDLFEKSVVSFAEGDTERAEGLVEQILVAETRADSTHRNLSLQVAEGAFFGGLREDMLNLMERIDDIADSAKDAARFLSADSHLGEEARTMLESENMRIFLSDLKSAVRALRDLVQALQVGRKEALAKVQTVEEFEEEADAHKDAQLKELFTMAHLMSPLTVIQLRDFIFMSDNIADNAEDASDVILVMLAKGYG